MISTSMPRDGWSRVTTAPAAKIGLVSEPRSFVSSGNVSVDMDRSFGPPAPLGVVDQVLLHVQQRPAGQVSGMGYPGSVRLQQPRRSALVECHIEQLGDLGDVSRLSDRGKHLHPAVEVAVHEVGGAHANRRLTAVGEPEQPTVLEKTAEDAAHA